MSDSTDALTDHVTSLRRENAELARLRQQLTEAQQRIQALEQARGDSQRQIRILTCKQCGCAVGDGGLCGYECPNDDALASERDPESIEVRIYSLTSIEPVPVPAPASVVAAPPNPTE